MNWVAFFSVAGVGTFETYVAIPMGFAFKLSPWTIYIAAAGGGIVGALIATFLGDKIKLLLARFRKPKPEKPTDKKGLIYRLWDKYGLVGIGLIGTGLLGAPIAISVGTAFHVNLRKLLFWVCIAIIVRCAIFTLIAFYAAKAL
jgi:membrane protein YqaA with SNARE-associated domain